MPHHVDVLPTVPRPPGQPRVEAQRRERTEDVLVQRLVIALDVVGHLRGRPSHPWSCTWALRVCGQPCPNRLLLRRSVLHLRMTVDVGHSLDLVS